jgi:hypothetical protein
VQGETVVIERRFHGPPDSGQGGYACGLLARTIAGAAEVSLRSPPPLERPLQVTRGADGRVELRDGETVVAEGRPATLAIDVPAPAGLAEAEAAVPGYAGFAHHWFPTCFGCGPQRAEGDGLRLFPGPVAGRDVVACPWGPDRTLADPSGVVAPEHVWAALDCPTAFACRFEGAGIVLARLKARIDGPVRAQEPHVITAWPIAREGRKHLAACAISTPGGEVLAVSEALWIEPRDPGAFRSAQAGA